MPHVTLKHLKGMMSRSFSFFQTILARNKHMIWGIIATLKKRYKYFYLKDILDFYQLDDEMKALKKE